MYTQERWSSPSSCEVLMTESTHHFRKLAAFFVAVVQVVIFPATQVLHVGCGCDHSPEVQADANSCPFGHSCSCGSHATNSGTEQDSPPEPHDSDSCPVCIAAFAVTTAEFHPLPMISLDLVRRLPFPSFSAPELYSPYRLPSRGPPFV